MNVPYNDMQQKGAQQKKAVPLTESRPPARFSSLASTVSDINRINLTKNTLQKLLGSKTLNLKDLTKVPNKVLVDLAEKIVTLAKGHKVQLSEDAEEKSFFLMLMFLFRERAGNMPDEREYKGYCYLVIAAGLIQKGLLDAGVDIGQMSRR